MSQYAELGFFNSLVGKLVIELSEPAQRLAPHLLDQAAPTSARITSLRLDVEVFDAATATSRPLTDEELNRVAYGAPRIRIRGAGGDVIEHAAPDGRSFRVRDLLCAVELTERSTRDATEWFGGVDVHHVFFEGLYPDEREDGLWYVSWGS